MYPTKKKEIFYKNVKYNFFPFATLFDRELNENPDINQYEQKIRRNGICRDKDKMQWRNRFDSVERLTVECFPWGCKSYSPLFFSYSIPFFFHSYSSISPFPFNIKRPQRIIFFLSLLRSLLKKRMKLSPKAQFIL